jgi:hypothetical protein
LKLANQKDNPVARSKSKTVKIVGNNIGQQVNGTNHYDNDRQPNKVLICNTARVMLNGRNPNPKEESCHGSLGTVRDIVYDKGESPTMDVFPLYVLVDFDM